MSEPEPHPRRHWYLGVAVAFLGVALVRLAVPHLPASYRPLGHFAGVSTAFLGLFLIALGVRRRLRASNQT